MPGDSEDARYQLAYQMAVDHLSAQFAALDELRTRVGVVLTGASVATGFLAGQALNTDHGFPAFAWVGSIAAFLMIVASAWILFPRQWQGLSQNAQQVLDDITAVPGRTMPDYYAATAHDAVQAANDNTQRLNRLYRWFSISLVLLVVDFAGWLIVLSHNN